MLEKHAPLQTKHISVRPRVPWYNAEILVAKRNRRKAERRWRATKSIEDLKHYKMSRNVTTNLMNKARTEYYTNLIQESGDDQAKIFKTMKQLFTESKDLQLPPQSDIDQLVNEFGNYYVEKISIIRSSLFDCHDDCEQPDVSEQSDCSPLDNNEILNSFHVLSDKDVHDIIIIKSSRKTCALDPMPTSLIIERIDVLLPVLTKMVNMSLQDGKFAGNWKEALVLPILKKTGLELLLKNY